ncbi:MAG: DNA polymerase/3'-5' exonuclease PolX [Chloroflexi bacterium]|nr:DNA polymerase/3'-5' exonuclease PolX [Chloroflexota bacterium]
MTHQNKTYTNAELADIFERIANLLEIKGEVVFKIRAYTRAAESLRVLGEDINTVAAEKRLDKIPGVGKAISEKIQELLDTGSLRFLEKLESEVPPSLLELLEVPDLGPRKASLFWKELGITNLAELEQAAREGKLRGLPGMGQKSEQRIIAGIEALGRRTDRMTLGTAWEHARRWLEWIRSQPGVSRAEVGGSLRRWRETIGDLDIVVARDADSPVMENFIHHDEVARIIAKGENKSSVELKNGVRIQLWAQPPEKFGSLWLYATGSKAHNVRLREMALKKHLSLSDQGMLKEDGELLLFAEEEEIYKVLGLPIMDPEIREDRGEIEAALQKRLPRLITVNDLRAELHAHSTWSDGTASIAEMARAAVAKGYTTLVITDHSASLGITRGLDAHRLEEQHKEIEQVRAELGDSLTLLHGIEVDIMADGSLALPDEVLAKLDIVIASLHTSLRQPRETITARLLKAIRSPHVDIIGHPSGRLLPNREGADLDWDAVLKAAKEAGVALEINASPSRLDLNDVYARRAAGLGIPLAINTDAHQPATYDESVYGVSVARRAWVEPDQVINTWDSRKIVEWLKNRQ